MSEALTEAPPRRKSLAEQIDRLDRILDGLADGLTDAVADATRAGARAAVREALIEVLTDPDLRRRLVPLAAAPNPIAPRQRWHRTVGAVRARVDRALAPLVRRWRAVRTIARAVRTNWSPVPVRRVLAVAAGAALVSAVCALLVPPTVTAVLSGMTAAGSAVTAQLALAWSGATRFRTDGDAIPAGLGTGHPARAAGGRPAAAELGRTSTISGPHTFASPSIRGVIHRAVTLLR